MSLIALVAAAASAMPAATPAPVHLTSKGIGQVKLGARYDTLRARGLVGRLSPFCGYGRVTQAKLRNGAKGYAVLSVPKPGEPRRVKGVVVEGNGDASGIRIGGTRADLRRAFPNADFNPYVVRVWKGQDGPLSLTFYLAGKPKRVKVMGAPDVAYCG